MNQYKPKNYSFAAYILLIVLLAFACGSPPMKSFYTLENNKAENPNDNAAPLCSLSLGINPIESSPPYDMSKIVFRPDALEVRFYTQSYWVSAPEEMFTMLVSRRIEAEHMFSAVDSSMNVSGPHLSLLIKINAIEEVDSGRDWQGRLAMSIYLRDEVEDSLLWKYRFDTIESAAKVEVKSVVAVLNAVYNREMDKAIASMKQFLSTGGCRVSSESLDDRDDDDKASAPDDKPNNETPAKESPAISE
jgi:ABC-type uncharacterized transport system auxiliary subunit